MLSYAVKRVVRSLGLFAALFLGVVLASTFFAGVNIGADITAKAALLQQLSRIPVDITVSGYAPKTSENWTAAASKIASIKDVVAVEIISETRGYFDYGIIGAPANSNLRKGLILKSGVNMLGENETYMWVGSEKADKTKLGSTIEVDFTYFENLSLPLKVVGFVDFDEKAYSIVMHGLYMSNENLLIVDWENTVAKLLDATPYSNLFTTQILVYLDRDRLINPWDISSSVDAIQKITSQVNEMVAGYGMSASTNLQWALVQYQYTSTNMRLLFFVVGFPVFFVAWYVGTTVSNVSYNLRRREIGLLLTKGFSNRQLFSLFLSESVIIGVIGGLIGVGLGFLFSPIFATSVKGVTATAVLNQDIIIITVIFSLAITLLSTFRPSRTAARLPPIEALREYTYIEEVKPYKQRLPWLALILGTYKIVMFLLGVTSIAQIFAGRPPPFTNIFLVILFGIWIIIDGALIFIGPLLFFWGFTKIFIRGSLKFQELVTRAAKFLGDLGTLATRNVQRNPARAASIAFLIALIVGYSFQSVGLAASEQDYVMRRIKADVGADISVQLTSTTNASRIANAIENLTQVESTALEYSFNTYIHIYSVQVRAVDPEKWLKTAYYENEWFSGNDVATAFQQMKTNNKTIILERSIATYLNKKVDDSITLGIGTLKIVGFFGPEAPQQSYTIQPIQYQYYGGNFWSYVPLGLYETSRLSASSVRVLVKLKPEADGKVVAQTISSFEGVSNVQSVAERLETYQSDLMLMGSMNILRVGTVFSILAASVATALVTLVSLQERKREVSIMSARGLSFKQLVTIFLTENLAITVFSVFLGVIVGLIALRGYISSFSATPSYSLVVHRITFPPDATLLLSACIILIFASAIIPVILLIKRYISKMERIVRI